MEKFIDENNHACFANFRYMLEGHIVGTITVKYSLFKKIVEWIHKQSEGNIEISIMKEESEKSRDVKTVLFKVKISNDYTPLSRYIAFYLVMITLRMSDDYEKFFLVFGGRDVKKFNGKVYMLLNDYGCIERNSNHCAFFIPTYSDDCPVSLPEEVYDCLFDVEIFNEVFKETFYEYQYDLYSPPYMISIDRKVSQTSCLLRICRHFKLLEKLVEVRLKDYGKEYNDMLCSGRRGKSTVINDFRLGLNNYKRVFLRRKNVLYELPENKFKPKVFL